MLTTGNKDPGTLPVPVTKRKNAKMSKTRDCREFMNNLKYEILLFSISAKSYFCYVKEARRKVVAQADVLSAGYEHIVRPPGPGVSGRPDTRSRSVESSPCHRQDQKAARYDNLCVS